VDTTSNDDHCGGCDQPCGIERSCVNSTCVCPTGETWCDPECADTDTDPNHCGGCDHPCTVGTCVDGVCEGGGTGGTGSGGTGSGGAGTGGGGTGGSGTGGSGTGGSGTGGSSTGHCLEGWLGDACDTCSVQTQADRLDCIEILNCFIENDCGPSSCTSSDAACGNNTLQIGMEGYKYATPVYNCMCL